MMPGNYPLTLYSGDSYEWLFRLWLDNDKTQPMDLTDTTIKAEIRDKPAGLVILELPCVVNPGTNEITMTLSALDCGKLPIVTTLVWDLQVSHTLTLAVHTVLRGNVSITEDVTDSVSVTTVAGRVVQAVEADFPRAPRLIR